MGAENPVPALDLGTGLFAVSVSAGEPLPHVSIV